MRINPYFADTRHAAIFKDGEELNRCNMKNGLEIMAPVGASLYFGEIIDCWDSVTITCSFIGLSGSRAIPCENLRIIPGSIHAYKPEDFKHGQKFTAKYKGQRIVGAVSISGGEIYLCQNVENGKYTKEKFGFDFSYVIYDGCGSIDPSGLFTELVFSDGWGFDYEAKINPITFEPVTDEWVEMTGGDITLGKTVKHIYGGTGIITRLDSRIIGIKWENHSYDSEYTSKIIFKNLLTKKDNSMSELTTRLNEEAVLRKIPLNDETQVNADNVHEGESVRIYSHSDGGKLLGVGTIKTRSGVWGATVDRLGAVSYTSYCCLRRLDYKECSPLFKDHLKINLNVFHISGLKGIITGFSRTAESSKMKIYIKWEKTEDNSHNSEPVKYSELLLPQLYFKSNQTQTIKPNTNEKREHKSIEVCRPVATITSGQRRPGNTVSGRGSKTTISRGHQRHKAIDSAAW
jgi:hypothetical protein